MAAHRLGQADLGDLRVFSAVVEHRSFSAAARALDTTTGAVSKRIAKLEDHLGVRLLSRTTRRVIPTEPGVVFYDRAQRVLAAMLDAELAVGRLADEPRGALTVTAGVLFGERHVAPLIAPFLDDHRQVQMELSLSDRFVNLLEERVDVAVRVGPMEDSALRVRKLGEAPMATVGSPAYFAQRGTPSEPAALSGHDCLRYTIIPTSREWRFRHADGTLSTVAVSGRFRANHGGAMLQAAVAGAGVALLPRFVVDRALEDGRLVEVLDAFRPPPLGVHAVFLPGRQPLPAVSAFVEHLAAELPPRLEGSRPRVSSR